MVVKGEKEERTMAKVYIWKSCGLAAYTAAALAID